MTVSSSRFKPSLLSLWPGLHLSLEELYVSRNNGIDGAHSLQGVGLRQPGLFNRWYLSEGTLPCDLYHSSVWEMAHPSKWVHYMPNRKYPHPPTPPRAEPLVTHNDFQQGRVRFYFKPLNINMQFHFHLKKIHLIHTAHPSQLTNPPAWFFFNRDTIMKLA